MGPARRKPSMQQVALDTAINGPSRHGADDDTTTHLELGTTRPPDLARRPVAAILAERLAAQAAREREQATMLGVVGHREARRRTIYVPDDTSVLTIHPSSSVNSNRSVTGSHGSRPLQKPLRRAIVRGQRPMRRRSSVMPMVEEALDLTGVIPMGPIKETSIIEESAAKEAIESATRMSKPPRRQSKVYSMQDKINSFARAPASQSPRGNQIRSAKRRAAPARSFSRPGRRVLNTVDANHRIAQAKPTISLKDAIAEQKRLHAQRKPIRKSIAPGLNRTLSDENVMFIVGQRKHVTVSDGYMMNSIHDKKTQSTGSVLNTSSSRAVSDPADFAILKDDLAHPKLYEENWLEHHEIALTQLLNAFFDSSDPRQTQRQTFHMLRSRLLGIYNDPEIAHLQKRLQASLMYGSLAVPKDVLERSMRLKDDIGQRRKFLNTILDTYDLVTLQAVAEVIVGHEVSVRNRCSTESSTLKKNVQHGDRKSLEQFLDHFFIQHSDVSIIKNNTTIISALARDKGDQVGSHVWAWRRTVIRSLMLVLMLDKAKHLNVAQGCLFQRQSVFKSSEAVTKALSTILLPSYGDIMRPLRHLKFDVFVEQQPIEEYEYATDNIATDLRDGIRLTRIVEILLRTQGSSIHPDSLGAWALSQQLKYPCSSRTQKLQNAMTALSAMVRLPSMPEKLLKDVSAYDIVDGHREKTLSLLWAMLGQYAMESLVDWNLVKRETISTQSRLRSLGKYTDTMEDISSVQPTSTSKCWGMLFQWAVSIAALRDITITNLTTSFAGPAAFNAILQTYLPYLTGTSEAQTAATSQSLESSLKQAGCSTAFTRLLSAPQSIIPTRDFTLTSLTFLAARLLPPTNAHRAASTIQRAFRSRLQRRDITRRIVLMRLAYHCAAVVGARDRVIHAAVVLQRCWRRVLDVRIGRLEAEASTFQCLAKGWLVRKRIHGKADIKNGGQRAGW